MFLAIWICCWLSLRGVAGEPALTYVEPDSKISITADKSIVAVDVEPLQLNLKGAVGLNVSYLADFGDGKLDYLKLKNVQRDDTNVLSRTFDEPKFYSISMLAFNGTHSVELLPPWEIEVVRAIEFLEVNISQDYVLVPPGIQNFEFYNTKAVSFSPTLECKIKFEEDEDEQTRPISEATKVVDYTYADLGEKRVSIECTDGYKTRTYEKAFYVVHAIRGLRLTAEAYEVMIRYEVVFKITLVQGFYPKYLIKFGDGDELLLENIGNKKELEAKHMYPDHPNKFRPNVTAFNIVENVTESTDQEVVMKAIPFNLDTAVIDTNSPIPMDPVTKFATGEFTLMSPGLEFPPGDDVKLLWNYEDGTSSDHNYFNFTHYRDYTNKSDYKLSVKITVTSIGKSRVIPFEIKVIGPCARPIGGFSKRFAYPWSALFLSRIVPFTIACRLKLRCPALNTEFKWQLEYVRKTEYPGIYDHVDTGKNYDGKSSLFFPKNSMEIGIYRATLKIIVEGKPSFKISTHMYFNVRPSTLVTSIFGGTSRKVKNNAMRTLDANRRTFDPDMGRWIRAGLKNSWSCMRVENVTRMKEQLMLYYNESTKPKPYNDSCFSTEIDPLKQGSQDNKNVIEFNTGSLEVGVYYIIRFIVEQIKDDKVGMFDQALIVEEIPPLELVVDCKINCKRKMDPTSTIAVISMCPYCEEGQFPYYNWSLLIMNNTLGFFQEVDDWGHQTQTGLIGENMVVLPNWWTRGRVYRLRVNGFLAGYQPAFAEYEFLTNLPPYGGACESAPRSGKAMITDFNFECWDWLDEGNAIDRPPPGKIPMPVPMLYTFFMNLKNESVIIWTGGDPASPNMKLPPGDPEENFLVNLTARICDFYRACAYVKLNVTVEPMIDEKNANLDNLMDTVADADSIFEGLEALGDPGLISQAIVVHAMQFNAYTNETNATAVVALADEPTANWNQLWNEILPPRDKPETLNDKLRKSKEKQAKVLSNVATNIADLDMDSIQKMSSGIAALAGNRETSKGDTLVRSAELIAQLAPVMQNVSVEADETLENVEATAAALVAATGNTVDSAIPRIVIPKLPKEREAFLSAEELQARKDEQEQGKITPEEREYFARRLITIGTIKKEQQERVANESVYKVKQSLTDTSKSMGQMIVTGQRPVMIDKPNLQVEIEKTPNLTKREMASKAGSLDVPGFSDGKTRAVNVRMSSFSENPITWANGSDSVTSGVTKIRLTNDDGEAINLDKKMVAKFPAAAKAPISKVVPRFTPDDDNRMFYIKINVTVKDNALDFHLKPSGQGPSYRVFVSDGPKIPLPNESIHNATLHVNRPAVPVRILIPTKTFNRPGEHYIGLQPFIPQQNQTSRKKRDTTAVEEAQLLSEFEVQTASMGCNKWDEDQGAWVSDGCTVSEESTLDETVCECDPPTTPEGFDFAASFVVAPNMIDFSTVFSKFSWENTAVMFTVIAVFLFYILIALIMRRFDKKDLLKWSVLPLRDNKPADKYFYLLTVTTGLRRTSGTKSKVGFTINGVTTSTGLRKLDDGIRTSHLTISKERKQDGFPTGSIYGFIMATSECLGDLTTLRLFHDQSGQGDNASWYISTVTVTDIQTNERFEFLIEKWLAVEFDDGRIDRTLPVADEYARVSFKQQFNRNFRDNLTDAHIWFSLISRPKRSNFTRVQRWSCCISVLYLTMITNAMFYDTGPPNPSAIQMGPFRFEPSMLFVSLICAVIVAIPLLILVQVFRYSRPKTPEMPKELQSLLKKGKKKRKGSKAPDNPKKANELAAAWWNPFAHLEGKKMLPHWAVYFAWLLFLASVIVPAFFCILYSFQWGKEKSEAWLSTVILSFFQSLLIVDPIKVIILSIIIALVCKKKEDKDDGMVAEHLKPDEELITVGKTTKRGSGKEDSPHGDVVKPVPEVIVDSFRYKRLKEVQASELVWEVVFYVVFIWLALSVGLSFRSNWEYPFFHFTDENVVKVFPDGFETVTDYDKIWPFIDNIFIPYLFAENEYNGDRHHWRIRRMLHDQVNYRLGPARLRQLRVSKKSTATNHLEKLNITKHLYGAYSMLFEEDNDFCVGWKQKPCDVEEPINYLSANAWKFQPFYKHWGAPYFAIRHMYGGGGYIADLDINRDVSVTILKEIKRLKWVDRQTRAVFIEFSWYNAQVNLFTMATIIMEFMETGGIIRWPVYQTFQLYYTRDAQGLYNLACQVIFGIILLYYTIREIRRIYQYKKQYCKDAWHVYDFILMIICWACVGLFIARTLLADRSIAKLKDDETKFVNLQHIAIMHDWLVVVAGLVNFFAVVKLLRLLRYNKRIAALGHTISNCTSSIVSFTIMFLVYFFAFIHCGYLLFCREVYDFKSVYNVGVALFSTLLGKNNYEAITGVASGMGRIYFLVYVMTILLLLFQFFMAIINESIEYVNAHPEVIPDDPAVLDYIKKSMFNRTGFRMFAPKEDAVTDATKKPSGTYEKPIAELKPAQNLDALISQIDFIDTKISLQLYNLSYQGEAYRPFTTFKRMVDEIETKEDIDKKITEIMQRSTSRQEEDDPTPMSSGDGGRLSQSRIHLSVSSDAK